jgi:hypothetical protein
MVYSGLALALPNGDMTTAIDTGQHRVWGTPVLDVPAQPQADEQIIVDLEQEELSASLGMPSRQATLVGVPLPMFQRPTMPDCPRPRRVTHGRQHAHPQSYPPLVRHYLPPRPSAHTDASIPPALALMIAALLAVFLGVAMVF